MIPGPTFINLHSKTNTKVIFQKVGVTRISRSIFFRRLENGAQVTWIVLATLVCFRRKKRRYFPHYKHHPSSL